MRVSQQVTSSYQWLLTVETVGAFGQRPQDFIKDLGRRIQSQSRERRSREYLLQILSIVVQRGNGSSVMGGLDGCFYLLFVLFFSLFYLISFHFVLIHLFNSITQSSYTKCSVHLVHLYLLSIILQTSKCG